MQQHQDQCGYPFLATGGLDSAFDECDSFFWCFKTWRETSLITKLCRDALFINKDGILFCIQSWSGYEIPAAGEAMNFCNLRLPPACLPP
ncbi:hypothetical protein GPJ56_009440 [Histomonas meleagridis]|uniref:uncharacterized protein n=1 Tax=Histomonas meleagridis TaxID=135588 RepID=UPI0035595FF7|nr:hypothetical protein GPJ56_009440 [Histomonas meleagridis]KAH0797455.1 hypothetical protein GO595_009776 [Histomonas meleagridis]